MECLTDMQICNMADFLMGHCETPAQELIDHVKDCDHCVSEISWIIGVLMPDFAKRIQNKNEPAYKVEEVHLDIRKIKALARKAKEKR